MVNADGHLEVFWSSNRDGSWSIQRRVLDAGTHAWGPAEPLTDAPYSQRNPLPLAAGAGGLLIYRSNRSIAYAGGIRTATRTRDFRYSGSTTADPRNAAKIALRGALGDFQTYTYDAGRGGERTADDWYARDTLGLYLQPEPTDPEGIEAGKARLRSVLREFLPATDRAVLLTGAAAPFEPVYPSGHPGDSYADTYTSSLTGGELAVEEDFSDELES